MSEAYRPEFNNNLATYPGPSAVKLDAAVNGQLGQMIVSVAGYGQVPAAANAATAAARATTDSRCQVTLICRKRPDSFALQICGRFAAKCVGSRTEPTESAIVYRCDSRSWFFNSSRCRPY